MRFPKRPVKILLQVALVLFAILAALRITGCDRSYSVGTVTLLSNEARSQLGRWPHSWDEVCTVRGFDQQSTKIREVVYRPLPDGRCSVTATGLNFYLLWVTDDFIIEPF